MKTRIIKVTQGNKKHFEVQIKKLFWWVSVTEFSISLDGLVAGNVIRYFDSQFEAENFIKNNLTNPVIEVV